MTFRWTRKLEPTTHFNNKVFKPSNDAMYYKPLNYNFMELLNSALSSQTGILKFSHNLLFISKTVFIVLVNFYANLFLVNFRRKWIKRNSKFTPNWKALVNVFSNFHQKWWKYIDIAFFENFLEALPWAPLVIYDIPYLISSSIFFNMMHGWHFLQSILGQNRKYVLYKVQAAL